MSPVRNRVLFVDKNPYGILIDTYKYCQYLQEDYDITYVCIDYGYPKVESGFVKVKYAPYTTSKLVRGLLFTLLSLYYVAVFKGFIFISYYPGCDILKRLLFWKRMHVDVRTLSVSQVVDKRREWNKLLNKAILKFDSISFISEGVRKQLFIPEQKRTYIVPLGADAISVTDKYFSKLNLLYVGTLNNRRIIDTVTGYHHFLLNHPNMETKYTIIGDGEELQEIKKYVSDHNLMGFVEIKGKLPYTELKPYFDQCNIGVSYIPVTDYYQHQPPTKTFEYVMSGLFCLATNTYENNKIINKQNGYIHRDSPEGFYEALKYTYSAMHDLNSLTIRNSLKGYTWKEIVNSYVLPVINQSY